MQNSFAYLAVILASASSLIRPTSSISWLSLVHKQDELRLDTPLCAQFKRYGLPRRQIRVCEKHPWLAPTIVRAADIATAACQHVFSDQRWNCSSINFAPDFTPDVTRGTAEQAVVHAFASASLAYSVAVACATDLRSADCPCGRRGRGAAGPNETFSWGGCAHNFRYGADYSNEFNMAPLRSKANRKTADQAMNKHNVKAGIKILKGYHMKQCKCHGISGSCQFRNCWMRLPADFSVIGRKLKSMHATALEVKAVAGNSRIVLQPRRRRREKDVRKVVSKDRLVYLHLSPDFCTRDKYTGSIGTRGRECRRDVDGSMSCDSMCCRRGSRHEQVELVQNCNCRLHWCCEITCDSCTTLVDKYFCY